MGEKNELNSQVTYEDELKVLANTARYVLVP